MKPDWQTVKGIAIAIGGFTASELQVMEGWVSLAIKVVTLIVVIITALIYWNKYQTQVKENRKILNQNGE